MKSSKIVEDRHPARLPGLPAGACEVYAVVVGTTQTQEGQTLDREHLLGEVEEVVPRTKE